VDIIYARHRGTDRKITSHNWIVITVPLNGPARLVRGDINQLITDKWAIKSHHQEKRGNSDPAEQRCSVVPDTTAFFCTVCVVRDCVVACRGGDRKPTLDKSRVNRHCSLTLGRTGGGLSGWQRSLREDGARTDARMRPGDIPRVSGRRYPDRLHH